MMSRPSLPKLLLFLLMAAYVLYFSWYTINRHNTLNSYAADLSLIDQPMWNTAIGPGGFMEVTWGTRQIPRLAEHFEAVLVPLSFLFWVWDDVRLLLIVQSFVLALGALPVFWIARDQLHVAPISAAAANWAALAFGLVYLLYPHLQAANIADFHADPFVVAPLLFAFWYALRRRWGWMWLWATLAMLTKENLPTLTAMLGLWLWLRAWQTRHTVPPKPAVIQGAVLLLVSVIWFLAATFLIVAPLAHRYFGTEGPIYLASRYRSGAPLVERLVEPARLRYLLGLFSAAGFLPLLAPDLLLLGLPVLAANYFSSFAGQYSGEQHYSAPLVAAFTVAAIFGLRRLVVFFSLREIKGRTLRQTVLIAASLWLLSWSLGSQLLHGWTPLSIRTETYAMTPAAAALPDLLAQIPAGAVVSASAGVHPHLAHRRVAYIFPTLENADYALVDVTDVPGHHPNDVRAILMNMLNTNWQVQATGPGLLLLHKTGAPSDTASLPKSFYDFARSSHLTGTPPEVSFGGSKLKLLGYQALDDPDDGLAFRFFWQTESALPVDFRLWPLIFDDAGRLLVDPTQVPMIATVWYPPDHWQPGEIIVTETLPQLLPDRFHLGLAAGVGPDSFYNPAARWPVTARPPAVVQPNHKVQLASFIRQGPFLTQLAPVPTWQPLRPLEAQFKGGPRLTGYRFNVDEFRPGDSFPLVLAWQTRKTVPIDYTVFVHVLAPDGSRVAQADAFPTWLEPEPTSQWPLQQTLLDRHTLQLPAQLSPGVYSIQIGLYNAQTFERLPLTNGETALELTQITVK